MYNYHIDLVLKIDIVLLCAIAIFAILTVVYAIIQEMRWKIRGRALFNIKKHVYELTLSGRTGNVTAISALSPKLFLDVQTNRNREAVFFNEIEQKVFKENFLSPKKLAEIEKIALASRNKWRRIEAALSLGYAQSESSLNILKRSLNDKDEDISYFSIIALGQIRTTASAIVLLDFLKRSGFYRYKIAAVLESFPESIADEIIKTVGNKDPGVSAWAIEIMARLKAWRYLDKIEKMASDQAEEVRAAACDYLGESGRGKIKPVLVKCLTDESWLVRAHAVDALSKLGCLTEAIGRINDPSLSVINSVKNAMIMHIEAAMPYIEKFLYGEDEIARRVSVEALESSGYIVTLLNDILRGSEKDKISAIRILEGMIKARARHGFENALEKFKEEDRAKLLEALGGEAQ